MFKKPKNKPKQIRKREEDAEDSGEERITSPTKDEESPTVAKVKQLQKSHNLQKRQKTVESSPSKSRSSTSAKSINSGVLYNPKDSESFVATFAQESATMKQKRELSMNKFIEDELRMRQKNDKLVKDGESVEQRKTTFIKKELFTIPKHLQTDRPDTGEGSLTSSLGMLWNIPEVEIPGALEKNIRDTEIALEKLLNAEGAKKSDSASKDGETSNFKVSIEEMTAVPKTKRG